jgi:hypothetical protein
MKISFPELIEEGEFSLESPSDRGVYGLICDEQQNLARYFVYWTEDQPSAGVTFDLIIGQVGPFDPQVNRQAVSLVHYGIGGPTFIDATSRPFAKRQALHCKFPSVQSNESDLAINALNIVAFVLKHDTRLGNCFGNGV